MVRLEREKLSGVVEVDDSYLGGVEEGMHGRETESKARLVVAAEEDGNGIGRIRLRHVPDVSADNLIPFVQDTVVVGSVVHTDGWPGYTSLGERGYVHRVLAKYSTDWPSKPSTPPIRPTGRWSPGLRRINRSTRIMVE